MARRHAEVFLETCCDGEGFAAAEPAADVPEPAGAPARRAAFAPGLRERIWWGAALGRDGGVGGEARHEPAELDAEVRRDRRAAPRPAAQADRGVSGGVEGGRPRARAARLGQPQHLRPRRRPRPGVLRARDATTRTPIGYLDAQHAGDLRALVRRRARCPGQAAAPRTRRSRRPTRSCSTVPNQLGVDYNAHAIESILTLRRPGARLALTAARRPTPQTGISTSASTATARNSSVR